MTGFTDDSVPMDIFSEMRTDSNIFWGLWEGPCFGKSEHTNAFRIDNNTTH